MGKKRYNIDSDSSGSSDSSISSSDEEEPESKQKINIHDLVINMIFGGTLDKIKDDNDNNDKKIPPKKRARILPPNNNLPPPPFNVENFDQLMRLAELSLTQHFRDCYMLRKMYPEL